MNIKEILYKYECFHAEVMELKKAHAEEMLDMLEEAEELTSKMLKNELPQNPEYDKCGKYFLEFSDRQRYEFLVKSIKLLEDIDFSKVLSSIIAKE